MARSPASTSSRFHSTRCCTRKSRYLLRSRRHSGNGSGRLRCMSGRACSQTRHRSSPRCRRTTPRLQSRCRCRMRWRSRCCCTRDRECTLRRSCSILRCSHRSQYPPGCQLRRSSTAAEKTGMCCTACTPGRYRSSLRCTDRRCLSDLRPGMCPESSHGRCSWSTGCTAARRQTTLRCSCTPRSRAGCLQSIVIRILRQMSRARTECTRCRCRSSPRCSCTSQCRSGSQQCTDSM